MKRVLAAIAISSISIPLAMAQETRVEQRQENRETRQENRQDAQQNRAQNQRQEVREDRREARQARAEQRLDNRSQYYTNETWGQLDPWLQRNNVTPMGRVAQAAGAAVGAAEKAVNTATDIANRANNQANARYGFTNPNGPGENGWFYDYYSYSPTYYSAPANGSTVYGSATRYYDLNNDGQYESLNVFRDTDSNASYDAYDRYDFGDADKSDTAANPKADDLIDSPEDASRHTVSGKVYASKAAKVNGVQNLIVRLSEPKVDDAKGDAAKRDAAKGDSAQASVVDIGPVSMWKDRPLQVDVALTATGPVERVGDKRILIAETVKIGDAKEVSIARGAPKIEGQVVDVTTTEIKGKSHTLAVVEAESKRQLVDLGPTDNLKVKVEPQTKIVVQGVPVRVRNHSIVQAERVSLNGQDAITIRRW